MRKYIEFCKKRGYDPKSDRSLQAYDRARGFNPIQNIMKKSRAKGGSVYVDV